MQKVRKSNKDHEVVIKLKAWQVENLLGEARLGIWAEDWCAALVQSNINTYDTHSARWILSVGHIIDSIKTQTGIVEENKEYGVTYMLEEIEQLVDAKSKQYEKEFALCEKQYLEQFEGNKSNADNIERKEVQ